MSTPVGPTPIQMPQQHFARDLTESAGLTFTPMRAASVRPTRESGGDTPAAFDSSNGDSFHHHRRGSSNGPFGSSRFAATYGDATASATMSPLPLSAAAGMFGSPALMPTTLPPVAFPSWAALTDALTAVDAHLRAHAPGSPAHPTCFHSSVAPAVTLADFAYFLCARTQYDTAGLAIGLALMVRHVHGDTGAPLGIADSSLDGADLMVAADEPTPPRPLCAMTAHRLLLACVAVGAKANFDNFIRNVFVAELVGVDLSELNWLEATLLQDLAYRAMPTGAEVADAPRALVAAVTAATAST